MKTLHNPIAIANYIIEHECNCHRKIYNIKLQKLLAFIAIEWQYQYRHYPYTEPLQKWTLGPSIKSVYKLYHRTSEYEPILCPIAVVDGDERILHQASLKKAEASLIERVCDRFATFNGFELVERWNERHESIDYNDLKPAC